MKGRDYIIVALITLTGVFLSLVVGCLGGGIAGALVSQRLTWQERPTSYTPPTSDEEWSPRPTVPSEQPVPPDIFPVLPKGALIQFVEPDSPAEQAGLQPGDIILEVDGEEITRDNPLQEVIRDHQPHERVRIVYWRAGEQEKTQARLAEHPDLEDTAFLGVRVWVINWDTQHWWQRE